MQSLADSRAKVHFIESSHDRGAEPLSVPSLSFCDGQRHSAAVASLKKKALVHLIENHQFRLNLFLLKITIYQDNLPSLPQHTHTSLLIYFLMSTEPGGHDGNRQTNVIPSLPKFTDTRHQQILHKATSVTKLYGTDTAVVVNSLQIPL